MNKFRNHVISLAKAGFSVEFVWLDFVQKRAKEWKRISLDKGRFIILSVFNDLKLGKIS